MMKVRALAFVVLLGCLLPVGASAAELRTVQVPTGGFSISLPKSWVNVTSAAPSVLKKLEQVPAFKAFAQSASQNGSLKLIAADPASNGSAYMDTGVARVGTVPLKTIAAATKKALEQTLGKGGKVTSKQAKISAGNAYVLHLSRKGSPNQTDEYLFVKDQVEYVLVYVATSASWGKYSPLFTASAKSFRLTPGPNLSKVVLAGSQVGAGYKLTTFPFGNSFIGEPTLDLCGGSYASESLRTGRLQVRYFHTGKSVTVSNEVVTYAGTGAQQALQEVTSVAKACARKPVVLRSGALKETYRVSPLNDPKLPAGSLAVKLQITASNGKKKATQTGVAVYQIRGNTLSGVYAFVGKGTTFAQTQRVAFHAAEQSMHNLGGGGHASGGRGGALKA
jgi:hypothetical protein